MSTILEHQYSANFLPNRFTQVKRINNNNEVTGFYSDCMSRLRDASKWNYMSLFSFAYKVTVHDGCGLQVNRELEKGDYLKVIANADFKGDRLLWFAVEDIYYQKAIDSSEETVCVTLRESENPGLITELSSKNSLKSRCELHLRRLINTVSMDIKIIHQNTIDQSKNFLNYFRWEMFAKQILLQL